jgi:hypothetical protein
MTIRPFANFGTLSTGDRIYTVREVAKNIWECSDRTVRDAIHDPDDPLPAFPVGRGTQRCDYRILESDLVAWMRRQQAKTLNKSQLDLPTRNLSGQVFNKPVVESDQQSFKARRAARLAEGKG